MTVTIICCLRNSVIVIVMVLAAIQEDVEAQAANFERVAVVHSYELLQCSNRSAPPQQHMVLAEGSTHCLLHSGLLGWVTDPPEWHWSVTR
jgi:hypothetical protein